MLSPDEEPMLPDEFPFSPYGASSVAPSPVSRMMASFAVDFRDGYDINLGVGYVNERTIPRDLIREAVDAVVRDPGKEVTPLDARPPTE